jgi:predicted RNase H-like HicB family nuclease
MKTIDKYHMWVEWSDEDRCYIGKCPDLITGVHGDDPISVFQELNQTVSEVIEHFESTGKTLPAARTRPTMQAV